MPLVVESYLPSTPMIEYFSTRKSFYHTFHTISKLVFSLSMVLVTVYLKTALLVTLTSIVAVSFMLLARLPMKNVLSWSLAPLFFAATFCIFLPLIGYPPLSAALLVIKAVTAAWFMLLLVLTTPITSLSRVVSKISPPWLADMLMLVSRYFFLFFDEAQRMFKAMNARGNPPLTRKVALVANIMADLFVRGYERAEKVYIAMVSRGYNGKIPSTFHERFKLRDALFVAAALAFSSLLVYLEVFVF
ncbi:MAG: energy-coupling factor transporter transmembrane component T [Candidatus Jordarchaeales archaeon]